jgi:hypothetical protein
MTVQQLRSPPGVAVTAAGVALYTNAADSGFREVVQMTFVNIDGVNDATLLACNWFDASAAGVPNTILPTNCKIAKLDSVTVTKTIDPGDGITGTASANGDIVAIIEVVGRESINAPFPQLRSPPGVAVTTAGVSVYSNPAGSGFREIVQITFNNIDGVNDAALGATVWYDLTVAPTGISILPINCKVPKLDSVTVTKTIDPGDVISASASANGDINAIVEIIGREAV